MDKGYLDMELLRFTTAGSVDDGKSTLIGRLLYDSKSIFEDQLEAVETASKRGGNEEVNLALLTDGLRSEREQGITIDVAYRYFATPKRKFIIADTPGHIQYTRNMVTGASTADLAIILIDARNGVLEQTLRHSYIASLLKIPHIVACINKMDLMDFSENIYETIMQNYRKVIEKLQLPDVKFIPISAKLGDNVVTASANMPWYKGCTLMELLENTPIDHKLNAEVMRFPVQYVIRPISDKFHDFRGYAGRLSGGVLKKGDAVTVLPSGLRSTVAAINQCDKELNDSFTPDSITVQLTDDIDVSRGDMIVGESGQPAVSQDVTMMVCWFNEKPLHVRNKYIIMHTTRETVGIVKSINTLVNINTLEAEAGGDSLKMNDIASITIKTAQPLVFDPYKQNRTTGSLIFVDPDTFETVGAGMIA
ncbi:sulfate adenylyltransferase subunit 1 [Bacteroidia bacterium]|nr:sulfate adenylyltransferase subunit 1 [Bacteroidia bacterium]